MSCDKIAFELQWVALMYDRIYDELQMVIATQKLSCKPNYKMPIFLIVKQTLGNKLWNFPSIICLKQ